jgi:IS30 family transposase
MARQLNMEERERISQLYFSGASPAAIGRALGRHPTTIRRELRRNGDGANYSAPVADGRARNRRRQRPRVKKMDQPQINAAVRRGLAQRWSPDQIAGRMRREMPHDPQRRVSRMTIYRWIAASPDRAHWESCLRFGKRRSEPEKRGRIKARADISGRPAIVDRRARFGDWEGDTVVGKQRRGGLVTLVERKSGFALAGLVKRLRAKNVSRCFRRLTAPLPDGLRHTATFDNGKEFADHSWMHRHTGFDIYFARPYHAWERGCNENFNGLLRDYFPKGTDLAGIGPSTIDFVLDQLNDRPRKRHDYRTPREVLGQYFRSAFEM